MLKEVKSKSFKNGVVYALKTEDGFLIETTDTFLPFETKSNTASKEVLHGEQIGDRTERWMIGVSTMSGCPVRCKFCATGSLKKYRNLTAQEIVDQVFFILENNYIYNPCEAREFKINYTRMGEPFLNIDAVKEAISIINKRLKRTDVHHYISTIGIKNADYSWIKGNITLQLSVHSLLNDKRNNLIPFKNKVTLEELGQIRTESNLKTTINMTLVDEEDFDIVKLKQLFNKDYFFIKLSPINVNTISESNMLGAGIVTTN
jgi:23S rRNA (adenine2503-C2)-methyltransferase